MVEVPAGVGDHVGELPEQLEADDAEHAGPGGEGRERHVRGHSGHDRLAEPFCVLRQRGRHRARSHGRAQDAGGVRLADQPADHRDGAAGRGHGVGRRLVAGHRRAVDQRVLVRVRDRPVPRGPAAGQPASGVIAAVVRPVRRLHGRAERAVAVDDERGEKLVAAREVPVDRRGDHSHLPGHRPQRQPGGAVCAEMTSGDVGDLACDLRAHPLPGRSPCRHAPTLTER